MPSIHSVKPQSLLLNGQVKGGRTSSWQVNIPDAELLKQVQLIGQLQSNKLHNKVLV